MPVPRIVLVRPRNPLNIGAVARAMANFGFEELYVVDPHPPVWEEARRSALAGESVLRTAKSVATLQEALAGCTRVAGTTTASRRRIDGELIPPAALRRRAGRGKLAIVFGSEKNGLSREEFSYCHYLVRIPTVAGAPSMNLAQAVVICCYEWMRGATGKRIPAEMKRPPAAMDSVLRLLDIVTPLLEASNFFEAHEKDQHLCKLRSILLNAKLRPEDVALLTQASRKLEYRLRHGGV